MSKENVHAGRLLSTAGASAQPVVEESLNKGNAAAAAAANIQTNKMFLF